MSLGSHMKPRHGVSSPRSGPQTVDWNDYEWNDINPKRQPVDFQLPPPESQSVLELVRKLLLVWLKLLRRSPGARRRGGGQRQISRLL